MGQVAPLEYALGRIDLASRGGLLASGGEVRKMPNSGTRRVVAKWAPDRTECVCATCRRPMGDKVKHCVLDHDGGAFVLCDPCYLRDERRYGWEHRGDPHPQRWALSGVRGR